MTADVGLTHVGLAASNVRASIDFYARFADMQVVHERVDPSGGNRVVWLSDRTRPFVVVLIEKPIVEGLLVGSAHLGVACESRREVDRRCSLAAAEGRAVLGPMDSGYPVGYWGIVVDPDGHNLELSYGQEVGLTVEQAGS